MTMRKTRIDAIQRLTLMVLAASISGCGGGGSSGETPPPPPPAPAPAPAPGTAGWSGFMLVDPLDADPAVDAAVLRLDTGQLTELPRSDDAIDNARSDAWYAGKSGREVLRVDQQANVDIYDVSTVQRVGGFALQSLPNTEWPEFYGPVKLSPDGRYILTYWKQDHRQDDSELVVLDRDGTIIESGSPYNYDTFWHSGAFDWLPDGRLVYLAGRQIIVQSLSNGTSVLGELPLPVNVSTNDATMSVNPEGSKLVMSLQTTLTSSTGLETTYYLLYVSNLDGTDFRQLTTVSDKVRDDGIRMFHNDHAWSPDGKWIAFLPEEGSGYGSPYFRNGCPDVVVVPAAAASAIKVDGLDDAANLHIDVVDPATGALQVLRSCGSLDWIKGQ